MIKIVEAILNVTTGLIGVISAPIDLLITSRLPNIANALISVASFFSWLKDCAIWCLSWLPFNSLTWSTLVLIWVFCLTVPIIVNAIKLVIRWYIALKP